MQIIKIFCLTLVNRKISLVCDLASIHRDYAVISFDRRRLQQVLYNLLSNAAKFTRKGEIKISGDIKQIDNSRELQIEVSVSD